MKKLLLVLALLFAPTGAPAQIINTLPFILQNGTPADAAEVMADFNQIVNNVNTNAAKNGINSDITALLGLTTPLTPSQGGSSVYIGGTSTGTANAIVVAAVTPATGFAVSNGRRVVFTAGLTNTGATTLNVFSSGVKDVYKLGPSGSIPLTGGEIVAGSIVEAVYDGTRYQLITNNLSVLGPLTNVASATTTDLATVTSHNANITGNTTITSFGANASLEFPIYYLKFAGSLTLTYNGTSLLMPGSANIQTAQNDTAVALYLGSGNWQIISYQRASGTTVVATVPLCGASGLSITNNSGTPNTLIDMTALQTVMQDTAGVTYTGNSISVSVNTTVTGANGLDTGTRANSTWYYLWFIGNGTTTAGLASLSSTAPTMPAGYTYKCRLGAMLTDGSANFLRTLQKGRIAQYVVGAATILPVLASGAAGTYSAASPTLAATAAVTFCIPATAPRINIGATNIYGGAAAANVLVAPNVNWGGTNRGPAGTSNNAGWPVYLISDGRVANVWITLETTTLAWANSSAGAIMCFGWEDAVNAN